MERQMIKFLKAVDLLSKPSGTTIREIGKCLEISRRSVYRHLAMIQELSFPVYEEKLLLEKEKRWKLDESYVKKLPNMNIPNADLTLSEIISLYLIKNKADIFKNSGVEKYIESAYKKLSLFLPENLFKQLDKIRTLFISSSKFAKDYKGKEKIIEQLTDAMLKQKTCYVEYHSFGDDKIKNFAVDPLHFFENNCGLYLMVNTTRFKEIRTLAVERINNITITGSLFEYPKDFNPDKLLETAFDIVYDDPIEVKIRFSAGQARYIKERKWSVTQKIEDQPDGSLILSMTTSGWWDVKKWVLSYGAEAEVIEPESLRKEIIDELKTSLKKYK